MLYDGVSDDTLHDLAYYTSKTYWAVVLGEGFFAFLEYCRYVGMFPFIG